MNRVIIVGDLFPVPSNFKRFSENDTKYLFGDRICELFDEADYRICNLEGPLSDGKDVGEKTSAALRAPISAVAALKGIGIDCCTLANNHITDAGHQGVIDTINALDSVGIRHIGAGINSESIDSSILFNVGDRIVGLYNVAETMYNIPGKERAGAHLYDEYCVCNDLEALKEKCDYLIVIYHGGAEKYRYPSPETKKRFHRMVDSGADMVLSQHTHCVGSEEYYNGAYLLYGQGNFLFRSFNNEYTDTGIIIELVLSENKFVVKKHLVRAEEDRVRYAEDQDFVDFDNRSILVKDDVFLQRQFEEYCCDLMPNYLAHFQANNLLRKVLMKCFPSLGRRYLLSYYNQSQLLFLLHSYRSEQNREAIIAGMNRMLLDK